MYKQMKFKEKIWDKFVEFILKWIVEAISIFCISLFGVIAYIKDFLKSSIEIKVWECITIIFIVILVIGIVKWLKLMLKSKRRFQEGTEVTLVSNSRPIMTVGNYNYLNNKAECTWFSEGIIKKESINQNILKEYHRPNYIPQQKRESKWSY